MTNEQHQAAALPADRIAEAIATVDSAYFSIGQDEALARLRMIRNLDGADRRAAQDQLAGFLSVVTAADVSKWRPPPNTDMLRDDADEFDGAFETEAESMRRRR